jgi:DNA-binding IclR family transcriptional regulator
MASESTGSRYLVQTIVHATRILRVFASDAEELGLRDVVHRTGFDRNMCFRLLYTLRLCGFLDKVGENRYRLVYASRNLRRTARWKRAWGIIGTRDAGTQKG